jgi:hypothetical protein
MAGEWEVHVCILWSLSADGAHGQLDDKASMLLYMRLAAQHLEVEMIL